MKEVSLAAIRSKAHEFHDKGASWHFHIFTPACSLSEGDRHEFVLEQTNPTELWVAYSDRDEKELDQALLPLLHGAEVLDDAVKRSDYQPSTIVQTMLKRAKELNEKGFTWHHHMLFPDCQFNSHPGKFCLMLEDPETKETLESVTDQEPIYDLQHIEPLYAAQTGD